MGVLLITGRFWVTPRLLVPVLQIRALLVLGQNSRLRSRYSFQILTTIANNEINSISSFVSTTNKYTCET